MADRTEQMREYNHRPEVRVRKAAWALQHSHRPDIKEENAAKRKTVQWIDYQRDYHKEYNQRPEIIVRTKLRRQTKEYKEIRARSYQKHREKRLAHMRVYGQIYRQQSNVREARKFYMRLKRKLDEQYCTAAKLRSLVKYALARFENGKNIRTHEYGIDVIAIINHLGPMPKDGRNYQIDHIRPLSSFDFKDPEQIKQAFAPENHQWLVAAENWKKNRFWVDAQGNRRMGKQIIQIANVISYGRK